MLRHLGIELMDIFSYLIRFCPKIQLTIIRLNSLLVQVNVSHLCGFELDPYRASAFWDAVVFLHYLCQFSVW